MTTRIRTNKKMNAHLESLETREAPTVGLAGAWQAALAQAQSHSLRGAGVQGVQRSLSIPRPGSTFQAPAVHFGVVANSSGAASQSPIHPMSTLMQSRRAAVNTAMFNRAHVQPALAARPLMRTPTIVSPPTTRATPMTPSNSPNVNANADAGTPAQSLPANVDGALNAIYQAYKGSSTIPVTDAPGLVVTDGTNVGVSVHGNGQGSFSDLVSTLQNLGMKISATDDVTWTVAGMLPISQLPTAAQTPQTLSITAMYKPITR